MHFCIFSLYLRISAVIYWYWNVFTPNIDINISPKHLVSVRWIYYECQRHLWSLFYCIFSKIWWNNPCVVWLNGWLRGSIACHVVLFRKLSFILKFFVVLLHFWDRTDIRESKNSDITTHIFDYDPSNFVIGQDL